MHAAVPGGVAGSREQAHLGGHLMVGLDQVDQARVENWLDRVRDVAGAVVSLGGDVLQVFVLGATEQVARVREGRDPAPVHQPGVPAGVVEVQVRAEHRVDALGRTADRGDVLQEGGLQVVEHAEVARTVVADAGVDHDPPVPGPDHERLEGQHHLAVFGREVRIEPVIAAQILRTAALEQHREAVREAVELDDARHLDVADLPLADMLLRQRALPRSFAVVSKSLQLPNSVTM